MADFRVPEGFRNALVRLSELSDATISELCKLLEENPNILVSRGAAYESAAKQTTLSPDDAQSVIEVIVPLLYFKASSGRSTQQLVKEVTAELARGDKNQPKLAQTAIGTFGRNLAKVLELSGLALQAKAISVASDVPRLFSEAKILSDIRPIFGDKVTDSPLGAAILHNLRISYAQESEERELFVQLDSRDLRELQDCIKRALENDATVRNFLQHAKLRIFETS